MCYASRWTSALLTFSHTAASLTYSACCRLWKPHTPMDGDSITKYHPLRGYPAILASVRIAASRTGVSS